MTLSRRIAAVHLAGILTVCAGPIALGADASRSIRGAGSVTVTVNYTGQGAVDDTHRVWIWVFDTPDIGPGSMPILEASVSKNGGSTTIADVGPDTVWIAVGYDLQGGSTGNRPPGSGWPIAVFAGVDRRPASVSTTGNAVTVVTFDDSVKMP